VIGRFFVLGEDVSKTRAAKKKCAENEKVLLTSAIAGNL